MTQKPVLRGKVSVREWRVCGQKARGMCCSPLNKEFFLETSRKYPDLIVKYDEQRRRTCDGGCSYRGAAIHDPARELWLASTQLLAQARVLVTHGE